MKYAMIIVMLIGICFAGKEMEPRSAIVNFDGLRVFVAPPKIMKDVNILQMKYEVRYELAEQKDELYVGDTVLVFEHVEGFRDMDDVWVRIIYRKIKHIERFWIDEEQITDTIWCEEEGWVLEYWKEMRFLIYIDEGRDEGSGLFSIGIFLYGQDMTTFEKIEDKRVNFGWIGPGVLLLSMLQFVVIFATRFSKWFGLKKTKNKIIIWLVMVGLNLILLYGWKASDIMILIKGRVG